MSSGSADIRWKQRLENFRSAFENLKLAIELANERSLTDLEKQGLIQSFEFTHELAWNVLKDFLMAQGVGPLFGSKDTTREAFNKGLVSEGETWMNMIRSRNQTSHTYNKKTAEEIVTNIQKKYFAAFAAFEKKMSELADK
jgi:nucleotidyltransferase substrate binding protein (TIGR01987 family)